MKKTIALLVITAFVCGLLSLTACTSAKAQDTASFADVAADAWYAGAVAYVQEQGLMNGNTATEFAPEESLTRAMLATVVYRLAGEPPVNGSPEFTDVPAGQWYSNAIIWATQQGVVNGYGGGLFGPEDPITREQLAVMLWRYAGSPAAPDGELAFTDAEQVGAYAREALGWAVQTGVMNGKGGGVLDPKGLATRAQAASMLRNFLENG